MGGLPLRTYMCVLMCASPALPLRMRVPAHLHVPTHGPMCMCPYCAPMCVHVPSTWGCVLPMGVQTKGGRMGCANCARVLGVG